MPISKVSSHPATEETAMMIHDLPVELTESSNAEPAHDAYNAAFCELGLRWYWDRETYAALLRHSADPQARIRHYIETRQAHLLKAYDATFLATAIHERAQRYKPCTHRRFDWSQAAACEVGI
jgi:hypothetical protein